MNVMEEYIGMVKRRVTEYANLIFEEQFDEEIFDDYLALYINVRYYNITDDAVHTQLKVRVPWELEREKDKLIINEPDKQKIIEDIFEYYKFVLYLDNVIANRTWDNLIEDVCLFRIEKLQLPIEQFREKFEKMISANEKEEEKFFEQLKTDEFTIKLTYYKEINNVQRVNIKNNFEIPYYSLSAIEKAISKGIINEDKLFVEYYLITIQVLKDLIRGNFNKQYIVEFADTLFAKKQKINKLLTIIRNVAIQDKLNLKMKYSTFLQNVEEVYELMRNGYRIAIILDEKYEFNLSELEKLNMFKIILINKEYKYFQELVKHKETLKNIIIEL